MNIKLKNGYISSLIKILDSLELKSKESRMRTRFKNMLTEHESKVIQKERKMLIEEYAKIDESGKYIAKENGDLDVSEEEAIIINEGLRELLCEEMILICDESNKDMLITVSNIILEGDFSVSGQYADAYDEWCVEFEQVLDFFR